MVAASDWIRRKLVVVFCLGALAWPAFANAADPGQAESLVGSNKKLTVAVFPGGFNWPLWIVKERGIDNALRLNIEIIGIRNSEEQMAGLQAGKFDIVMTGFDNVIAYSGRPTRKVAPLIRAVMGGDSGLLSLVSRPGLDNYTALKGRNIGVDSERTGYAFALYGVLAANGLAKNDYTVVKAGGVKQRFEALNAGTIDATLLVTPFDDLAISKGAKRLERVSMALGAYQGYVGATRTKWAEENRQHVVNYVSGYRQALGWLFNPRNKQAALEAYVKHVDGATLEQARLAYDVLIAGPNGINRTAKFDARGAANVLRLRKQFGGPQWSKLADAMTYFDPTYYQQASRSTDN